MVCKRCSGPLPPLAVAFDDPYCSRVCLELDLFGESDLDAERSKNARMYSTLVKKRLGYNGDGVLISTLRSMGFSTKLQRRLGVGVAICKTCGEQVEGSYEDLPWLAVLHVKESGHGGALDTKVVKYECRTSI